MDRIPNPNKKFANDMEKFAEVLRKYDVPILLGRLSGKDFARMAERLGVI